MDSDTMCATAITVARTAWTTKGPLPTLPTVPATAAGMSKET